MPEERVPRDEWRYVMPPLAGYPMTVSLTVERQLTSAFEALTDPESWPAVRETAEELLAEDAGLHPAVVLLAQVDFVERSYRDALDRLVPVVDELPAYDAGRMLAGRLAELVGDLPAAYASFRAVAHRQHLAAARAAQLRERAVEIVANRLHDALGRGRVEEAGEELDRLVEWAPGEEPTLRARRAHAVASGDLEGELAAVRELAELEPDERELQERAAQLELQVGEPTAGLRLLQALSERHPDDPELADKLAEAKFVWRLVMLPNEAKRLVQLGELTRADFASILYWLFPDVRYGKPESGLIVNDIFEHPAREQIVRVVNMELMSVDRTLHAFEPERPVTRRQALESFLGLLDRQQSRPACLGVFDPRLGVSTGAVCETAARCGLIEEAAACFPEASLSGAAAAQMSRRTLEQLGVE